MFKAYSRSIECFLSCQLMVIFGAATVLLDWELSNFYKVLNLGFAILIIFFVGIIPSMVHPLHLATVYKRKTSMDVRDCYQRLVPGPTAHKSNELFVSIRYLSILMQAIMIPLVPVYCSTIVMLVIMVCKLRATYCATFRNKCFKAFYLF